MWEQKIYFESYKSEIIIFPGVLFYIVRYQIFTVYCHDNWIAVWQPLSGNFCYFGRWKLTFPNKESIRKKEKQ